MILVDTSAWVEFLRDTGSAAAAEVEALIQRGSPMASCGPIRMELLAGARTGHDVIDLRRLLDLTRIVDVEARHFDDAAQLYRQCRSGGETVRKLVDCLIAACAISADAALLHRDSDFEVLARHTALRVFHQDGS